MLTDPERAHLDSEIYPRALREAGELDSSRNREIAMSDYWLFLQSGGGSDAEAVQTLVRGLRACPTRQPGPSEPQPAPWTQSPPPGT